MKLGLLAAPAIALLTVLFAAHVAVDSGVHHAYALSEGTPAVATIVSVERPKGKTRQGATAHVSYGDRSLFIPASDDFQNRYQHVRGTVAIHIPASPYLRPVIDADPPWLPWLWPVLTLFGGLGFAAIVHVVQRAPQTPETPLP